MKNIINSSVIFIVILSICLNSFEAKPLLSKPISKMPQIDHQRFKRNPISNGDVSSSSTGYAAIIQTEEPIIDLRPGKECIEWVKQPITNLFKCAKISSSWGRPISTYTSMQYYFYILLYFGLWIDSRMNKQKGKKTFSTK